LAESSPKQYVKNCTICGTEIIYRHKHKPSKCPTCGERNFDKPIIEIKLFHLQDEYLINRDSVILGKMYNLLVDYSKNLIKNMIHNSYYMDNDILDMKAHEAATKFIEYYLSKPEFKMDRSFGAYLKFPIRNVLYNSKKIDKNTISFNTILDSANNMTFEDVIETMDITTIYNNKDRYDNNERIINESTDFTNDICSLLSETATRLRNNYSTAHVIKVLLGVKLHFTKTSVNLINDYYNINENNVKENTEKIMMLIFQYLKSMER